MHSGTGGLKPQMSIRSSMVRTTTHYTGGVVPKRRVMKATVSSLKPSLAHSLCFLPSTIFLPFSHSLSVRCGEHTLSHSANSCRNKEPFTHGQLLRLESHFGGSQQILHFQYRGPKPVPSACDLVSPLSCHSHTEGRGILDS